MVKSFFDSKIFVWVVVALIVASLAYAFFLVGSPAKQRAVQLDQQRISHLSQISYAIDEYWRQHESLPETLQELGAQQRVFIESITDPRTGEQYEYASTGNTTYELCAAFEAVSFDTMRPMPKPFSEQKWDHGMGRECFQMEVTVVSDAGNARPL